MKTQSTVVLLALFLVAFALFALVKLTNQPTAQQRAQRRGRILSQLHEANADDARRLLLRHGNDETELVFDVDHQRWNIARPIRALADPSGVRSAINALINLQPKRNTEAVAVDSTEPDALAAYGLDKPVAAVEAHFLTSDGRKVHAALHIGNPTPDAFGVNVMAAGDDAVFVVDPSSLESVQRSLIQMRRRELISIDEFNAVYLEVQGDSGRLVAQKRDNRWQLTEPLTDRADEAGLRKLIRELRDFKVADDADFIDDDATEKGLAEYGLTDPVLVAEVRRELSPSADVPDASTQSQLVEKLLVGKSLEGNGEKRYAKLSDQNYVVAVPTEPLDKIDLDPQTLRSHDLVQLAAFQVDFFRIVDPAAKATVVVGKPGTAWKIYEPKSVGGDATAIEQFLRELAQLQVQTFLDDADPADYGLSDDAAIAVSVWEDALDGTTEQKDAQSQPAEDASLPSGSPQPKGNPKKLLFGKHDAQGKRLYATRAGKPGVVAVDDTILATLKSAYLALRDRKVFDFVSPNTVERIHLIRDGNAFTLVHKTADDIAIGEEIWRMSEPIDAPAQRNAAENVVALFSGLRAAQLVAEDPEDLAVYGLDSPTYDVSLTLKSDDGEQAPQHRLLVGQRFTDEPAPGGGPATELVYAKKPDDALVFTIPATKIRALGEELRDRTVFAFAATDVTALSLTYPDRCIQLQYVAPDEGAEKQWSILGEAPFDLDASKVHALVEALADLQATAFEQNEGALQEHYGLTTPVLTVEITFGEDVKKVLRLGAPVDESARYAATSDLAGAVFRVADPTITSVARAPESLATRLQSETGNPLPDTNPPR